MGSGEREQTAGVTEQSSHSSSETDDSRVGGALEIEDALSEIPGTDAALDEEEATGQVIEVQKLPSESVPDAYPIPIDSEEAIGFRVLITADRETMVYLAWPDTYDDSADLACLLTNLDIPPDRFADIIGEEIELVVVDGQWAPAVAVETARPHPAPSQSPDLPDPPAAGEGEVVMNDGTAAVIRDSDGTRVVSADRVDEELTADTRSRRQGQTVEPVVPDDPDTDPRYYYGVLGFGGLWVATAVDLFTGLALVPFNAMVGLLLLVVSPVVFPFFVYRDSEHVTANSEWSPHIAWTIGSVFWLVNAAVFLGYIYKRRQALSDEA